MHGQGTLRWASGERYDGEWIEGEEDGLGVFTWRDGTTYDGFWQSGKKHGIGVRISSCLQGKAKPAPAVLTCSRLHCLDLGNLDTCAVLSRLLKTFIWHVHLLCAGDLLECTHIGYGLRVGVAGVPHSAARCQAAGQCFCTARRAGPAATSCRQLGVPSLCALIGWPRYLYACL